MKRLFSWILISLVTLSAFAASPTQTLPIVYLNTTNNQAITSKDNYIGASLYITSAQSSYPALGSNTAPVACQVKGRGNWTWNGFDKKPYKIKFDVKQSVLGMPNNKHWCLLACADDYLGFLKMPAGFAISEAVGLRWTPRMRPVELVLNGKYQGLYFLTEHVRIAGNRIKIKEQANGETQTDLLNGGWLVEIDNYESENNITFTEGNGQYVMVSLKEPDSLSTQQRQYIVNQLNTLNEELYNLPSLQMEDCLDLAIRTAGEAGSVAPPRTAGGRLPEILDLTEAAKYYLVQEIMEDCESYHGSCFLYKDRDSLGVTDKWKFGPVWDFGNAYNRHEEKWIYTNPTFAQYWIGQLAQWPEFQQKVKEQWYLFYHEYKDSVRDDIRALADQMETAAKNDAEVWRNTQNYCDNSNFSDVRDRFFRRYDWRINWLYSQWGEGIRPSTEDIENPAGTSSDMHSRKILRNGQILILRNGRTYSLDGRLVE